VRASEARTILVAGLGEAEGSRGAAAALACAAASPDGAPLLVDLGGRPPRPTLISSAAASALEARVRGVAGVDASAIAARGHFCQLAASPDRGGLEEVAAAVALARAPKLVVLHLPERLLALAATGEIVWPAGALLRADLPRDCRLAAGAFRELRLAGIPVSFLKTRLSWIAERRACFGALAPDAPDALPASVIRRTLKPRRAVL
jgi:hypothetical protein